MDYIDVLDRDLIKKLQSSDRYTQEEGFEGIYYKYAKLAFTCIYQIVKNYQDAEDLVNDTFLAIFNNRSRLQETKNLKYYIVVSAKNAALNFRNSRKLEVIKDDQIVFEDTESNDDGGCGELIETLKIILNEDEYDIIYTHVVLGVNFEMLGQNKNKSANTIKTTYYRAIEKVNKWFKNNEGL